ncbi:MAG: ParA family protein [Patescibacteria group bacterium]|nr:ParA family protein [Patescibacteria group bacterium]MDD4304731.1 ParA family protein [Patescibacteria group bacterium]MDD4695514.1 ParA family protein [Patescibacteria group bacterium]
MSEVIAIVNQKGGVGKTTTTINLAAYLTYFGKKVLVIDIDSQGNASSGLGINYKELEASMYEVLIPGPITMKHVILSTGLEGLHLAPASPDLAGASVDLVSIDEREFQLLNNLKDIKEYYDFVLIDCPPSLGLLTINALSAATDVLIPVQSEYYALEGLGQLLNTIGLIQENLNPKLNILGAVLTMYDKRNKLSEGVFNELYKYFPNRIFRTVIPRNVRLAEAPSHGKSILDYDLRSPGAKAYERLAREVLESYNLFKTKD